MARVTHVKKAQQRYATVPVLDENGDPKKVPVMKKVKDYSTGEVTEVQKTTKHGRPVFMKLTVEDRSKPKPPYTCDHCREEIKVGTPYKHISPKSGPYGGRKLTRHESCPTWMRWEYSSSMSARLEQISHYFWNAVAQVDSPDDVQAALDDAADEIRSLAEEKRESASNIEEGFGHPTEKSEELEQVADDLEAWADDVSSADIPDLPEPEDQECEECGGEGKLADDNGNEIDCTGCEGQGVFTPEDPTEDQLDEWRSELQDALSLIDEAPV